MRATARRRTGARWGTRRSRQPQLFELGPESLVMMDGANTCGECDPPFAYSRPRFQRFPLRGMQPARAPWPGTFGGPGHGHHENEVRAAP